MAEHIIKIPGVWWLPETSGEKVEGVLTIEDAKYYILTIRGLHDSSHLLNLQNNILEVIFGENEGGEKVSLFYNRFTHRSLKPSTGYVEATIRSTLVLDGFHLNSLEGKSIKSTNFQLEHFEQWFDQTGFKYSSKKKMTNFNINYRRPKTIKFEINENTTVHFVFLINSITPPSYHKREFQVRENVIIHLRYRDPISYNESFAIIRKIQDFFSIALQRYPKIKELYIEKAKKRNRDLERARIFQYLTYNDDAKETIRFDFLFRYEDISQRLTEMLSAWFQNSKELEPSRILYSAANYSNTFLESKFLFLCQAFEAYHRRFFKDKDRYVAEKDYDSTYNVLVAAIPKSVSSSFRTSLIGKIKYLNEYSLSKRLQSIINPNKEVFAAFIKNKNAIQDLVDHRNYLTHREPSELDANYDPSKLFKFCEILNLILNYCFLNSMKIENDHIIKLFKKNRLIRLKFSKM